MGIVIEHLKIPKDVYIDRLIIYQTALDTDKEKVFPVNKALAAELIKCKPMRRTMQLEKCFVKVLESLPDQPIIKDIDVLFNPAYKVDVMKLLSSAYKQKQFSLVWPGSYADGKLTYSEEGYPDYRVYEINDYDIMYVI